MVHCHRHYQHLLLQQQLPRPTITLRLRYPLLLLSQLLLVRPLRFRPLQFRPLQFLLFIPERLRLPLMGRRAYWIWELITAGNRKAGKALATMLEPVMNFRYH